MANQIDNEPKFTERELTCMMHLGTAALLGRLFKETMKKEKGEIQIMILNLAKQAERSARENSDGDFEELEKKCFNLFEEKN